MKIIAGLGNPGDKYAYTRHNVGFMVVDKLVKDRLPLAPSLHAWKEDKKFNAFICKLNDAIIVKPLTYMNKSGDALSMVKNFFKVNIEDVWVIHDDIDLPVGKIRVRKGGGSAGHNGIESIIRMFGGAEFVRFRIGIGKGKKDINKSTDVNMRRRDVEKHVLSKFRDNEGGDLKKIIKNSVGVLESALKDGLEKTMNKYN